MNQKHNSKRTLGLMTLLTVIALLMAACVPAAPAPTATALPPTDVPTLAATAVPTQPAVTEPVVQIVENADFGPILVDEKGMTLYGFTKDTKDVSTCAEGCLKAWPPLLTNGSPVAGDGVDAALLGSTATTDGREIVTYNGMPLYYWAADVKPGDTTGQNVGEVWFVVNPTGEMVMNASVPNTGASSAQADATLNVADIPGLGQILVDAKGMTLYMFAKDEPNKSNCAGECLAKWPPLLADGAPQAGDGVDAALLGTAALADGSKIVTYNDMPLYYFAKDTQAGDVLGQNVGSVWFVVAPDGSIVEASPTAANDNANSNSNDNSSSNSSSNANEDDYSKNPSASSSDDIKLAVAKVGTLGSILVDAKGMTLYMFAKDEPNKSNCAGECLTKWPPFLAANGQVKAEDGVDESLIGTAPMPDGSKIVTYNGMPLYYFAKDTKPGDATGQTVGEVWFVVAPDGKPVQ